jgi:NAD(P)-dependent dehydrogenase (short-subunit alcohol dehydrogenase family)
MSDLGIVTIVGAGPGLGAGLARRFGREGHPVGLIARDRERLDALVRDLQGEGISAAAESADARRPDDLRRGLDGLRDRIGSPNVLCYSPLPDIETIKPVVETTPEDLQAALELGIVGAAAAVRHVLPAMRKRGRGTMLFTTGSAVLAPNPDRATSGVANAAQTVYIRMLHDTLAAESIHVAHTVIVGPIGPGMLHDPADVAEHLWQRHIQRDAPMTIMRRDPPLSRSPERGST